jgi:hypothetical protein
MANEPATYNAAAIGEVFKSVVGEIRKSYEFEMQRAYAAGSPAVLMNAVDIELSFKSVMLTQQGWVLFGKNTKESTMEIKLATRITPPSLPSEK